jgi:hypothetical protein
MWHIETNLIIPLAKIVQKWSEIIVQEFQLVIGSCSGISKEIPLFLRSPVSLCGKSLHTWLDISRGEEGQGRGGFVE